MKKNKYGNIEDIVLPKSQRTVDRWFNTEAGFERNNARQLGSNLRTFPLDRIADAHRFMEEGTQICKIVVTV